MKASELRIGNIIMFADYDGIIYRKISAIKLNEFGLYSDIDGTNFEICKPILITKEWLLKLGFEYCNVYNNYKIKAGQYYNSICYNYEDCKWYYNNDSSDAGCHYVASIASIKYVHKLQNLYFALTGIELTFKSE
jgi:hypothetical protein